MNTPKKLNVTLERLPDPIETEETTTRRQVLNIAIRDLLQAYHFERLESGMPQDHAEKWCVIDALDDIFHDAVHTAVHLLELPKEDFKAAMVTILEAALIDAQACEDHAPQSEDHQAEKPKFMGLHEVHRKDVKLS